MHKSIILGLLISLGLGSCATTNTKNASIVGSPFLDDAYFPVYRSHTRDYDLIENFLTNLSISTTLMDEDFIQAFSERHEKIFREKNVLISTKPNKVSYFISMYSPDRVALKLQSKAMWNIYLKVGDTKIRPSRFKRMRPKSKWSQFFPVINFWSKEFLLEFELPEDNLVKKDLELFMSGPKGQMNFEYKK